VRTLASAHPGGAQAASAAPGARAAGMSNRALARGACTPDMVRSLAPSLGNRATVALLQRKSHCDPPPPDKYKEKAGKAREQTAPSLKPTVASLVGGKAWELYNFDIDKSFVKTEHEAFIRDTVVPALKKVMEKDGAYVMVVGEASTTAKWAHNEKLSKERAQCVIAILERELKKAGVKDLDKVLRPWWAGEALAFIRRLEDEFEHEEDRLVTIIPVDRDPDQNEDVCTEAVKTRASGRFKIKYACAGPGTVKINIGDESVAGQPTYRKFRWITSPAETCRFRAGTSGDALYGARKKFSLALRDPDQDSAPSDLVGEASLQANSGWLFAAGGKFSVQLKGAWPATCKTSAGEVNGWLVPEGPVVCGDVPQPERDPSCDDKPQACSDDEKMAPAKKFTAHMERFAADLPVAKLLKRLPWWARKLIEEYGVVPSAGVALVSIGTKDGPEPRRMRRFLFLGAGVDGDGLDGNVGVDKEAESSDALALATEDPGDWDSKSDFDHWVRAKLEVTRGSNVEELHVGGMTFSFHGLKCNGTSSNLYGMFRGVTGVDCEALEDLPEPPERDCGKDECPTDTQLDPFDEFQFKIGRASLSDLPAIGKPLADRLGCQIVAARVNIESKAADPIYREFLFIGRRKGCAFDVGKSFDYEKYSPERRLSVIDPENALDPSDFAGLAKLTADGKLTVQPATLADEYSFKLPGAFAPSCMGGREVEGALIPVDDVKCGEAPDPKHDTTPDDTSLEACETQGNADLQTILQKSLFRGGAYDYIVEHVTKLGAIPLIEYTEDLQTLKEGQVLRPAVFVGKNFEGVPVVTIVEMEVVRTATDSGGNVWVSVRFLSDACSYDKNGNAVFVLPIGCKEMLPYKGLFTQLTSVNSPRRPSKVPPPETDPPPPEPGAGSKSGAVSTPAAVVLSG
jgi:hypothetical protein